MSHAALIPMLTALALALLALGVAPCAQEPPLADPALERAPLVVVGRTGGTLLGPAHMHLLVYSDGHVAYVSRSGAPGDRHDVDRELAPELARALHARLLAARAQDLPNQGITVTDVPLTTVTVLEGGRKASAHTFSYWIPTEAYEPVDRALADFVAQHVLPEPDEGSKDR